jgi:hypothetical protein
MERSQWLQGMIQRYEPFDNPWRVHQETAFCRIPARHTKADPGGVLHVCEGSQGVEGPCLKRPRVPASAPVPAEFQAITFRTNRISCCGKACSQITEIDRKRSIGPSSIAEAVSMCPEYLSYVVCPYFMVGRSPLHAAMYFERIDLANTVCR